MIDSDKREFGEMMTAVFQLYKSEPNKQILRLYWKALLNYSIEQVQEAVDQHVVNTKNGQFLPKPADILKQINGGKSSIEIKNEKAGLVWLAKKREELRTGNPAYSLDEITRMELGVG